MYYIMDVPLHHVKQDICTTRPAYREGRRPKAVKVYTVNNESSYLIIQGVPSVGATSELSKLCNSCGEVEDFKPLDEYQNEDKYTDVYMVKYKKIQSARFAKRKLDEYSFFGGSLHVCYAPEYETVQETREKLQNRRIAVAQKIRQHAKQAFKVPKQQWNVQNMHQTERALNTSDVQKYNDIGHDMGLERGPSQSLPNYMAHTPSEHPSALGEFNRASDVQENCFVASKAETKSSIISFSMTVDQVQNESEMSNQVFHLPLPPTSDGKNTRYVSKTNLKNYGFSRVPTAHATLPKDFDGRLNTFVPSKDSGAEIIKADETSSNSHQFQSSSQLVIKEFKAAGPAPRFVPRQAVMAASKLDQSKSKKTAQGTPLHHDELRKNAFRLGKVHGPEEMPGRKRSFPSPAQNSVNETISSIRSKISKIINESVGKKA